MPSVPEIAPPSDSAFDEAFAEMSAALDRSTTAEAWRAVFLQFDDRRRLWKSWSNLTRLHYSQDTRRADYREAQAALDARAPHVISQDDTLKRRFLASAHRAALEAEFGSHVFALWECDVSTFSPEISEDLVRESNLVREYTELLATASVRFDGEDRSLGGLGLYLQDAERDVRHAAERARWSAFSDRATRLDELFTELVRVRDRIARTLGFPNFIPLAYRRMRRVDYDATDVARYREEVARDVVPLARKLIAHFGSLAGYDRVRFWDETNLASAAAGHARPVAPLGDARWVLGQTADAFAQIGPPLGEFATFLLGRDLVDVENRAGKALGAYCTNFPTERVPFVFANFSGSRGDVRTLVHEFGHAFANYRTRDVRMVDYMNATSESAETHSMALEYLAWPQMERYFGDGAAAYRREHLFEAILFLPYAVAIDHFQHLAYEHPEATPAQRNGMWLELERRYLPWRDYGDLAHPASGGLWQEKRHVYVVPFYYIDYALALCCALQFWVRSETDREKAVADYVALCSRGGEAPFGDLVRSAGLRSPFESGALADVVRSAGATF